MRKGRIRVRVVGRRPPAEDGLRAVYQQVLRSFATTGHAPPAADLAETAGEDEDAADEDVDGLLLDDGPAPRAGRLVAGDEGVRPDREADLVAGDVGVDGGAATAEEAAMHVVDDDDYDIRSES